MGGPCFVVTGSATELAPAATDNFQVAPFHFAGALWSSVEQCYQAHKLREPIGRESIRQMTPRPGESDQSHGLRVWSARGGGKLRSDWDAVKLEVMLRVCRAKLAAHASLREQLVGTGDSEIVGAPSTRWRSASGDHEWSTWNGRIQMLLREELRQAAGAAATDAYRRLAATFLEYYRAEGGACFDIPGHGHWTAESSPTTSSGPVVPPRVLAEAARATAADVSSLVNRLAVVEGGDAILTLMRTLVSNVRAHPAEPRYRKVRLANPKIAAAIGGRPEPLALLVACGFALDAAHERGEIYAKMSEATAADAPALERLRAALEGGWSWPDGDK